MERLLELWGKLPTTQARVTITLGCVVATAVRYTFGATWAPSYEWLGFLLLMSGVDAAQFYAKRTTDMGYMAAKTGTPPPAEPSPDQPSKE